MIFIISKVTEEYFEIETTVDGATTLKEAQARLLAHVDRVHSKEKRRWDYQHVYRITQVKSFKTKPAEIKMIEDLQVTYYAGTGTRHDRWQNPTFRGTAEDISYD